MPPAAFLRRQMTAAFHSIQTRAPTQRRSARRGGPLSASPIICHTLFLCPITDDDDLTVSRHQASCCLEEKTNTSVAKTAPRAKPFLPIHPSCQRSRMEAVFIYGGRPQASSEIELANLPSFLCAKSKLNAPSLARSLALSLRAIFPLLSFAFSPAHFRPRRLSVRRWMLAALPVSCAMMAAAAADRSGFLTPPPPPPPPRRSFFLCLSLASPLKYNFPNFDGKVEKLCRKNGTE